jgi:histidinol-phosphatase
MNQLSPAQLLEAVEDVARLTGHVALDLFSPDIAVETKGDGSPVTHADRSAEIAAREWITTNFPDHGILGEETGVTNPGAELRWILDPIDGTASFIRGVPLWGTLVAVARGEEVIAGAIYCPAVEELVCGANGCGTWWNGTRAHVSSTSRLSESCVLTTDDRFTRHPERGAAWRELAASSKLARGWSDCYGYLLVATGRAEAMIDPIMSPWDAAALYPVITEAGGVITDWTGKPTAFGDGAVATNVGVAQEVRRILGVRYEPRLTAEAEAAAP